MVFFLCLCHKLPGDVNKAKITVENSSFLPFFIGHSGESMQGQISGLPKRDCKMVLQANTLRICGILYQKMCLAGG